MEDKAFCSKCQKEFSRSCLNWTHDCHGIPFRLVCPECYATVLTKGYDGEYYDESQECIDEDYLSLSF